MILQANIHTLSPDPAPQCGCSCPSPSSCWSIGRVLTLRQPVTYCPTRLTLPDGTDITGSCRWSWGVDGVTWSCWSEWHVFDRITAGMDSDFYIRVLFKTKDIPTIWLNNISVGSECITVTVYDENPFLMDPCSVIEGSGFDIYTGWDCAMMMHQQMSDMVICMLGIPVIYFKVDPDVDTKSYTFKEYVMHSVTAMKQIKMMIADGQMPSSRPSIGEWDMDFETDWETELSKTQFSTAFGPTAFPKQRDFIWVPMQKRMYMVNTAYEEKNEGLMWHAWTWKLALVKWQDQDNVSQEEFEDAIDTLIVNRHDDAFALGETREGELTSERLMESPTHAATNLYPVENSDWVREGVTVEKINIVEKQTNHGNIIVGKHRYDMMRGACVKYQRRWCGDEGTMMIIVDTHRYIDGDEGKVLSVGDWELRYDCKTGEIRWGDDRVPLDDDSTYMILIRWGRSTGSTSMQILRQTGPDGIPAYKIKPSMYKFDFADPVADLTVGLDERLIWTGVLGEVCLWGNGLDVCGFKMYDEYINDERISEVMKYNTDSPRCIINDQCRPLIGDHGYAVK